MPCGAEASVGYIAHGVRSMGDACVDSPESRLSGTLALTIAASAAWRAHVALGWEAVAGGVHGLAHVARLWGGVVHVALGWALELVVVTVVERHAE